MALNDLNLETLRTLASEHNVEGRSGMSKNQLVAALDELGVDAGIDSQVSGFQQGIVYPRVPVTPEHFKRLLDNPAKRPENQSAPAPEQLNPHLFGPQGRIP